MTVADLIAELQRMPAHLPVKVLMTSVSQDYADGDSVTLYPGEADAATADRVSQRGGFVLIEGD